MNRVESGIQLSFPRERAKGFDSMLRHERRVDQAKIMVLEARKVARMTGETVVLVDQEQDAGLKQAASAISDASVICNVDLHAIIEPAKFIDNESGRSFYTNDSLIVTVEGT